MSSAVAEDRTATSPATDRPVRLLDRVENVRRQLHGDEQVVHLRVDRTWRRAAQVAEGFRREPGPACCMWSGVDLRAHAEVQADRLKDGERRARRVDVGGG